MTTSKTEMFCTPIEFLEDTEDVQYDDNDKDYIGKLQLLRFELAKHFPDISRDDLACVRNPYLIVGTDLFSIFNRHDNNQDLFIALCI